MTVAVRRSDARGAAATSPFVRACPLDADALVRALLALEPSRRAAILDSCHAHEPLGARFLIAGFDPFETIETRGRELRVWTKRDGETRVVAEGSPLDLLDERLAAYRAPKPDALDGLPAAGACVATLSYELARTFESPHAFARPRDARAEPDAVLAFFDTLVIHDYASGETFITSARGSRERLRETCEALERAALSNASDADAHDDDARATPALTSNFTREEYLAAVERVREHIYAGDIYQANLTQQFTCGPARGLTPERVFLRLRRDHPAPFSAFIREGARTIVSASPERFLRVEAEGTGVEGGVSGRRVEAWPIKGTRRRGATPPEDERLRRELAASEKDRAENVMIVDLLRNDLGRVCRFGSVRVSELCAVQEHPTLFHLVSKVRGVLREEVTAGGLLRATFPCGSITGAPKVRAMRVIDELEDEPRGLSMGAVGYFSFDGAIDMNVAIRTLTFDARGAARFNVGGGVVADSDPAAEYDESLLKAKALLRALGAESDKRSC